MNFAFPVFQTMWMPHLEFGIATELGGSGGGLPGGGLAAILLDEAWGFGF